MAALKVAIFSKSSKTWWLPVHSPTRPRRGQNWVTHTRTHSTKCSDAGTQESSSQPERTSKNPELQHHSYPIRNNQSHQILSTVHSPASQIYLNHYFISNHVSNVEVLIRSLIGTCIRRYLNCSTSHQSPSHAIAHLGALNTRKKNTNA